MPKNKGKGGKNRRRGKNENDNEKRELTFKEDGQEYAQVVKMLGYVITNCLSPSGWRAHRIASHRIFCFAPETHLFVAAAAAAAECGCRAAAAPSPAQVSD